MTEAVRQQGWAYLFHDETLVARVAMGGRVPEQEYEIDGVRYRALIYDEVTGDDVGRRVDVRVVPAA